VNDTENDLTRGEMVKILREFAGVFLRVLGLTFTVLIIATLNGSQMMGG